MAAGRLALAALLLLGCAASSGSSSLHQQSDHAAVIKPLVSPLKSCESLRVLPSDQVALLRGHFQKYQALERQIREMESFMSG